MTETSPETPKRRPTAALVNLLREVEAGRVRYSQYSGGFGARYENVETGRSLRGLEPSSTLGRATSARLITRTTLAERMGGGFGRTIELTDAGRAVLAAEDARASRPE